MKLGYLKNTSFSSFITGQKQMLPSSKRSKKNILMALGLTSLVDAFSILVIYLLVNTSTTSHDLKLTQKVKLPQTKFSQEVGQGIVLKMERGRLFIDEQRIPAKSLAQVLFNKKKELEAKSGLISGEKKASIIIQADKKIPFSELSPILLASSEAGYYEVKFAIINGGR